MIDRMGLAQPGGRASRTDRRLWAHENACGKGALPMQSRRRLLADLALVRSLDRGESDRSWPSRSGSISTCGASP